MAHEHEHKKLVLDYIARHGSITNHDAGRIGVGRLSARIYDLRMGGAPIITTIESGKNQYGETVRYARYWLKV